MAYAHRAEPAPERARARRTETTSILPFDRSARETAAYGPAMLARLIEGEIIPRLLLAHQHGLQSTSGALITAAEVSRLAHLSLEEDSSSLMSTVDALMARGADVEDVYFDLLAPAARLLGFLWETDACSFADVTIGLCRLQQLVYDVSDSAPKLTDDDAGRDVLFAMAPGDQHAFGLVLVSEHFRRSGWRTEVAPTASCADLVRLVSTRRFDLIGLSLADTQWLDGLPAVIGAVRAASCNGDIKVLVGGRVFSEQPALFAAVGADATAEDARLALSTAIQLVHHHVRIAC